MIDPVTEWFEITQYNDKRAISIANLVKLCGCMDTLDQQKSRTTEGQNLLVMSPENTKLKQNTV